MENKEERQLWNDMENMVESWRVKWYGKYGRKISWNMKWYGKYGIRQVE